MSLKTVNFRQIYAWMNPERSQNEKEPGKAAAAQPLSGPTHQTQLELQMFPEAEERWTQMRRVVCRILAPILRTRRRKGSISRTQCEQVGCRSEDSRAALLPNIW